MAWLLFWRIYFIFIQFGRVRPGLSRDHPWLDDSTRYSMHSERIPQNNLPLNFDAFWNIFHLISSYRTMRVPYFIMMLFIKKHNKNVTNQKNKLYTYWQTLPHWHHGCKQRHIFIFIFVWSKRCPFLLIKNWHFQGEFVDFVMICVKFSASKKKCEESRTQLLVYIQTKSKKSKKKKK